jgi:hypothetical protein
MSDFKGHCHCGNTEWTAKLEQDQQSHILWYVRCRHICSYMAWDTNLKGTAS